jgi:hypothetical protein
MMNSNDIILVALSIDHRKEAEFNDFYHHDYIPNLLTVVPEIDSVRRYEEYNTDASLRYYSKQFWTIYQFASDHPCNVLEAIQKRPGREKQKAGWMEWEKKYFKNLQHATVYQERYVHPRRALEGPFNSCPFFNVSIEVNPATNEQEFNDWYEQIYLPKNLADVPTWTGCRRYSSLDSNRLRRITIYETRDELSLKRSLELMRAPYRFEENASWNQWDQGENPLIIWEDAACFVPIYRYPD